jgi:ABC-2 type transport system permease protein
MEMIAQVFKHEWKMMIADRTLPLVSLLLTVMIAYGVFNGIWWMKNRLEVTQNKIAEIDRANGKLKSTLIAVSAGKKILGENDIDPSSPRRLRTIATLPPGPLASLSVGQSDLQPYSSNVSIYSTKDNLFRYYEIENPMNLLTGRFDLSFVLIYLLPLIILVLNYNLLSSEKEQGTLALACSQPVTLRTLVTGKVLLRGLIVVALTFTVTAIGIWLGGVRIVEAGNLGRVALWFLAVLVYAFFWFAVAIAVNSLGKNSSANAAILAGIWLLLVLVVPSLLNLGVSSIHPLPSRLEYITRVREADNESQKIGEKLLAKYYMDHPELVPDGEKPAMDDFSTKYFAVKKESEKLLSPVLDEYEQQLKKQQRLVSRYQIFSPAIVMQEVLNEIAGAGQTRYRKFQESVLKHVRTWQEFIVPKLFLRQKLTVQDYDVHPRFRFTEEPLEILSSRVLTSLLLILIPAGGVFWWGISRLKHYPVSQ